MLCCLCGAVKASDLYFEGKLIQPICPKCLAEIKREEAEEKDEAS